MDVYTEFFYTLSAIQCGHPLSHEEHAVEIPFLPMRSQHASTVINDIPIRAVWSSTLQHR
jgi:hypothetical protein